MDRVSECVRIFCGSMLASVLLFNAAIADESGDASAAEPAMEHGYARNDIDLSPVDRVVVYKAARRMELHRRGRVVRSYKIALGLRPTGHKEQEGDYRTPEGRYTLERRNPQSDYFLSIQISYPNATDVAHAKHLRVSPGDAIMIHGLPNNPSRSMNYYSRVDWTDGCIAVSNSDMVEIWLMTTPGTPIEILP